MLNINNDQMKSFEKASRAEFHRDLLRSLRTHVPEHTSQLSDEKMMVRILEGHETAEKYGIVTRRGVAQFVTLDFVSGKEFHQKPAVKEFLDSKDLTGDQKMNLLVNMMNK